MGKAPAMIVRRELAGDESAVHTVHAAAFGRDLVDARDVAEARLVDELRRDGDLVPALALVAMVDDAVVGHVGCSRATVGGRPTLGLGPLGVLPANHGTGVGTALMHAVLGAADALDQPAVFLLGDPGYYRRFGFVLARPLGVVAPNPSWAEHFQVRPLRFWDDSLRGDFRYSPAFDRM
jgi:putative acetyltransferase